VYHVNGDIAEYLNATVVAVRFERMPLLEEDVLEKLGFLNRIAKLVFQ